MLSNKLCSLIHLAAAKHIIDLRTGRYFSAETPFRIYIQNFIFATSFFRFLGLPTDYVNTKFSPQNQ